MHVDDPGAAHAGDARRRDRVGEAGLVAPRLDADHLEARASSVAGSMRTRSIAPAVARWPQLICAPSNAGPVGLDAANSRVAVAEHDLGVGADVDEQLHRRAAVRALGEHRRGGVGADVAGDARADVARRVREVEADVDAVRVDGSVGGQRERRMPSGVGSMPSTRWCMIGLPTSTTSSTRSRGRRRPRRAARRRARRAPSRTASVSSSVAARVHHHVRHPAHQVLAEPDLRVHPPAAGDDLAGRRGRRGDRRSWSSRRRPRCRARCRRSRARSRRPRRSRHGDRRRAAPAATAPCRRAEHGGSSVGDRRRRAGRRGPRRADEVTLRGRRRVRSAGELDVVQSARAGRSTTVGEVEVLAHDRAVHLARWAGRRRRRRRRSRPRSRAGCPGRAAGRRGSASSTRSTGRARARCDW